MAQSTFENIIVVDDDPDILSQMIKIFVRLKVPNVKTFTDGQLVIEELEKSEVTYDCIFIDVRMPGMSGVGLIQHIKSHKDKKIKDTYCVPIVGSIAKEETVILQEINCLDTVTKPIAEGVFLKKLEELLQAHNDPNSNKNFQITFTNALLDKQYKQAEQLLLPRIKKDPNSIHLLVMYSELLIRAKQMQKAEEFLNKVLKTDANYIPALNLMSKIYIKLGKFEEAMGLLEKAKRLSPLHIERLLVMGEMSLGSGDSQMAEDNFRNALKINPCEEKASFGLGRALATQGKIEESKKVLANLKKGIELASFFNNKGILLVRSKKINEGISLYQNAIKVMEDTEREHLLLYNIALGYSKLGDVDNAMEYARKSMEKSPKDYLKPRILFDKLGKDKKAVESGTASQSPTPAPVADVELLHDDQFLLTGEQKDFIMGGLDDDPKTDTEELKGDDEFITFGL